MRTFRIKNVCNYFPRAECGDVSIKALTILQPFQHSDVRIRNVVVAVDALVVGKATERFVVAGIGEEHVIRDEGVGAFVTVTKDLSLLRDDLPEERHQRFAAFVGGVAPVGFLQRRFIFNFAVLFVHQRRFGAVENLLPAETVGHDEDDVLGLVLGGNLSAKRARDCEEEEEREDRSDKWA